MKEAIKETFGTYNTVLPDEKELAAEIERTQALLQDRKRLLTSPKAVGMKKSVKAKRVSRGRKRATSL